MQGVPAFVDTVVGKMGEQLQRILALGVRNVMVENLVPMGCMPFTTLWVNGETGCVANDLLDTETALHDAKLQAKVNALKKAGANIVMLDLTKALRNLFENGPAFGNNSHTPPSPSPSSSTHHSPHHHRHSPCAGFSEAYKRCCTGSCGGGDPYTVCNNPGKHVIFDSIHPTEAAWKALTNLYLHSAGFTKGPTLHQWFQQNEMMHL
jgi:phospholipase/lecithinase/hemolysin